MGKYTPENHEGIDAVIDAGLQRVIAVALAVPESVGIVAVILGGGYGRGEGGVFIGSDGQPRPYNDFDLFVLTDGLSRVRRKRLDSALREAMEPLNKELGLHVDFGPAVERSALSGLPFTMMWQELKKGHQVLYGPRDALAALPERDMSALPLEEGAKLLLNRGTGLWLAKDKLDAGLPYADDDDFAVRNIWKAVLACGDSWLIARGLYSDKLEERQQRLILHLPAEPIAGLEEWYRRAVEFKLHPTIPVAADIVALWPPVLELFHGCYLDFFRRFYRRPIPDMRALQLLIYHRDLPGTRITPKSVAKNLLLNVMAGGIRWIPLQWYVRYPRTILFTVFPGLLFDSDGVTDYIAMLP